MDYIEKLANYKKNVLKIYEDGKFNYKGIIYPKKYILPMNQADKNIMVEKSEYKYLSSNIIELNKKFEEKPIKLSLHRYWYHLNSSQILALNYFFDFLNDKKKLNHLLDFLKIQERAIEATLEYEMHDKSEIDVAIKLENGKFVFIEVKYSESEFGPASSKKTDYASRKEQYYSSVGISFHDFMRHYQFVRNIVLGVDGNYSVFLVPRFNRSITTDYNKSLNAISNADNFDVRLVFWEDLLDYIQNTDVNEKYFTGINE